MNKMKWVIGDWSDDGHGKSDEYHVETTATVEEVQRAYWDSCILTGVSFHSNYGATNNEGAYGHMTKDYSDEEWAKIKHHICAEYEDSTISADIVDIFVKHGFVNEILDSQEADDGRDELCPSPDSLAELLNWFVKLSLPEGTEMKITTDSVPAINGWWSNNLNVGFGYGLYY